MSAQIQLYILTKEGFCMEIKVCKNYEEMSFEAAKIVAEQLTKKPDSILGLATGSTPIGTYKELIKMYNAGEIDFKDVISYNLDEYYPIKQTNDQSYKYFMNENLFKHVNIKPENTHIPNGETDDPENECLNYDKMVEAAGGIDLQILGIGQNGHIGFNEPDETLHVETHITDLTESTIEANSRFFASKAEVPTKALTMGLGTIMKAKKIIILANGVSKRQIINDLINGGITTNIPASLLKLHKDVVLICDKEAYASLHIGFDIGGTDIKYGVIDSKCNIIEKGKIPTRTDDAYHIVDDLAKITEELSKKYTISTVGVGTAGRIDSETETIVADNLPFKNFPFKKALEEKIGLPLFLGNDANCAALGEAYAGVASRCDNIVMVTLGTGVGGGIITNKKIYSGASGDAGEIGHMSINSEGIPCPCGNIGCWERYASVTALIEQTKAAAKKNPDSILAKNIAKENGVVNGKTVFDAMDAGCEVAKEVFDKYVHYLVIGIKGILFIFNPEAVVLSGGITAQGDRLLKPVVEQLNTQTPIMISKLQNDAGIMGAAMLYK